MDPLASGNEQLALSDWELGNLHLPPVTTVTFYSGTPPIDYLRERVATLLKMNPWLGGRLVIKGVQGGVVALRYPQEPSIDVSGHFYLSYI